MDGTIKLFQGSDLTIEDILIFREGDLAIEQEQVHIKLICGLIIVENGNLINKKGRISLTESGIQICDGNYTDESNGSDCGTVGSGYIFNADGNIECMGSAPFSHELHCFCADGNGVNLPNEANDPEGCPPGPKQSRCKDTTFYQNILPITWLDFSATQIDENINITWITSNEINCKEFLLECATNGKDFKPLATILSRGPSENPNYYQFTHTNQWNSTKEWYYRISQIDLDGTIDVYRIISVVVKDKHRKTVIYPNPVNGQKMLYVQGSNIRLIEIFNLSGHLMQRIELAGISKIDIPMKPFANGLYTLRINRNEVMKLECTPKSQNIL